LFLALIGMTTLFGAFLIAYLILRRNAPVWPPPGAPVPPQGLWISTLVIAASSATFVRAVRASARDAPHDLRRGLAWTLVLGFGFLLVQAILWRDVFSTGRLTSSDAYGTIFYSLTGLHAAHVIGGLVFLARTARRARRAPRAASTRLSLALCSTYWHYMGGVWIVLFAVLYFLN
jgi:cytochrome c oxidase subunit 3